MTQEYVIESTTETVLVMTAEGESYEEEAYWSNRFGWVDIDNADIFTEEEKKDLHLPMDSRWCKYPKKEDE